MGGLDSAIEELRTVDARSVSHGELTTLLRELSTSMNRLAAVRSGWVRELDRRKAYQADGHSSPAGWIAEQTGEDRGRASQRVRTAKRLVDAWRTKAAFDEGGIGERHAAAITRAVEEARRGGASDAECAALEAELVELAGRVGPSEVARHARRRRIASDHDEAAERARAQHAARYFDLRERDDGMVAASGLLTADDAEHVRTALDAQMRPEPGDLPAEERRSAGQRRADALVELARRGLDADVLPDKAGRRPHVSVIVDLATLVEQAGEAGELEWGGPISAATARRLACEAEITRVVVDADSVPLDLGRTMRTPTKGLRAAVVARDRACRRCGAPAAWCEPHHIRHWAQGGPTALPNLVLVCRGCHRLVHEGGWDVALDEANTAVFTGPNGRQLIRPPP